MAQRYRSAIVVWMLSFVLAVGTLLVPAPEPSSRAGTPGVAYAADENCQPVSKGGASHGKPALTCTTSGQTPAPSRRSGVPASQTVTPSRSSSGGSTAAALPPATGVIYVVDTNCCPDGGGHDGAVIEVDLSKPVGQDQRVISSGQNFHQPFGVVVAADGFLYVPDETSGVIRVDPSKPDGSNQTVISSGPLFAGATALALAADGTLYVLSTAVGLFRVDPTKPDGSNQTPVSTGQKFASPVNITVAPDGTLYVVDSACCMGGGGVGAVIKVDPTRPDGSNQTVISFGDNFRSIQDIVLAGDGMLYVTDVGCCAVPPNQGGVFQVDPTRLPPVSNQTLISSGVGFAFPIGIGLSSSGTLLVTDFECCTGASNLGGLIEVDQTQPNGSNQFLLSSGQKFLDPGDAVTVPQVSIADPAPVTEGTGANVPITFTVTRAPFSAVPLSVPFTVGGAANGDSPGIATVGVDVTPASGTATFAAGQTSTTATIQAIGDSIAEPTETFTVTFQPPAGVTATRATATGTIKDDDSPATLTISPIATAVAEGNSGTTNVSLNVTLSPASSQVVTVNFATSDVTATAGQDYTATSGTLTFQHGETSKTITIPVRGDTQVEADETFSVTLSTPTGGAALTLSPFSQVTITNDDGAAQLSIADASVNEGNSGTTNLTFTVTLSAPIGLVSVNFATADGTATAGSDYAAAYGTVTFQPGETSKTVSVPLSGDTAIEPDETFTVTLSNPSGPSGGIAIGRATATGTILNDDGAATLSIADAAVTEGNSGTTNATFTVTLSAPIGLVGVQFATSNGTAQAGQDYTAATGTLTFNPGETSKTVTVPVSGDTTIEPDETFTVTLSNPTGGAALGRTQGLGKIADDEPQGPCGPRPKVVRTVTVVGGKLQVHLQASPLNGGGANALTEIRFGTFDNAQVTVNGQAVANGQTISLPASTQGFDFTVERATAGQATTVPYTAVDGCGPAPGVVGAGTGAGF